MQVGCYTLDMYCDGANPDHRYGEFPHQFTGETREECNKQARKLGWRLSREGDLCPRCKAAKNKKVKTGNNA